VAALENAKIGALRHQGVELPRLRWIQMLAISIFYFALNFHWSALGIIILPGQVLKLAGDLHKGSALAFVLIPGAFVALFSNPLFGFLSDRTSGKLAMWGRRRPYILFGTLINIGGLLWMATATSILSLMLAYTLVQFASNAAQAPFHALLPDVVPVEQRGQASGIMGLLLIAGNIGGVLVSGLFIDVSRPQPIYQQGLWLTYGIMIAVLVVLVLVTTVTVRERSIYASWQRAQHAERQSSRNGGNWLSSSMLLTGAGTIGLAGLAWGFMALPGVGHIAGLQVSTDVQQVILEVIATIGLLRLFDFNPRRDRDFAWVFVTRLLMMLGIYTIQTFLQYYMRDVVGVMHPEQQTTNFVILVSLTSLGSSFAAGWLSDRLGRKRIVYISGGLMALVGLVFVVTHVLSLIIAAGAIFGLGYGAYQSVDWALVADVLPSQSNFARDMGIWNISLSLPQIIAPVLGGPLIDSFTRQGRPELGFQLLFAFAVIYCVLSTVAVRYIRGVK
jgi:Na+/melibiose symporter-like transporter